jgi:hypothetical protein
MKVESREGSVAAEEAVTRLFLASSSSFFYTTSTSTTPTALLRPRSSRSRREWRGSRRKEKIMSEKR